jgi:hypothetical protein
MFETHIHEGILISSRVHLWSALAMIGDFLQLPAAQSREEKYVSQGYM